MRIFSVAILIADSSDDAAAEKWKAFQINHVLARDEDHAKMKAMASNSPDPEVSKILVRPF